MNKKLKYFLIGLFVLIFLSLITFLVIKQRKLDNRPFKKIEFKESIKIHNETSYPRLDTVLYVAITEIQHIDTIEIYCYDMSDKTNKILNNDNYSIFAFVEPLINNNRIFKLFIKNGMRLDGLKRIISHESVHINQWYNNRLYRIPGYIVFENHFFNFNDLKDIDYKERPWEKEAFSKQEKIKKELEELLYE